MMRRRRDPVVMTRRLRVESSAEVVAVRRAVVEVVRGPDRGRSVELDGSAACAIGSHPEATLVLSDDTVSERHAEVALGPDGWMVRDLASTNGTRVGGMRVHQAVLDGRTADLWLGETHLRYRLLEGEATHRLSLKERFGGLVGRSPAMRRLFDLLEHAAASDATVLVTGESGTGKEEIAQSLHQHSARAAGPLVVVDCGSLPSSLIDSELFGHRRGAFTGAVDHRVGALEEASGGTVFLDEVGELPLEVQPRLLRALAERQVKPLGSDEYRAIDVRVIAATHRDLARWVSDGRFRPDLYYRLAVLGISVPPLRHRREDIPLIARELLARLRPGADPGALLTPAVLAALSAYDWPGNVRELRNTLEQLLVLGDQAALPAVGPEAVAPYHAARRHAIEEFERGYTRAALRVAGGSVSSASALAGISRQMFHRILRRHTDAPGTEEP